MRLQDLVIHMDNRQGFFKNVGDRLILSASNNFHNQKGPDGVAWQPLKPATIRARKKRKQTPVTTLKARGHLAGSINYIATNDEVRIGSTVSYAAIPELDGTIRKPAGKRWMTGCRFARASETPDRHEVKIATHSITIPARPFLGTSKEDQEDIFDTVERWLLS